MGRELEKAVTAAVAIGVLDGPHKDERLRKGIGRVVDAVLLETRLTTARARRRAFHAGVRSRVCTSAARAVVDAALAWDEAPGDYALCLALSDACAALRADRRAEEPPDVEVAGEVERRAVAVGQSNQGPVGTKRAWVDAPGDAGEVEP